MDVMVAHAANQVNRTDHIVAIVFKRLPKTTSDAPAVSDALRGHLQEGIAYRFKRSTMDDTVELMPSEHAIEGAGVSQIDSVEQHRPAGKSVPGRRKSPGPPYCFAAASIRSMTAGDALRMLSTMATRCPAASNCTTTCDPT